MQNGTNFSWKAAALPLAALTAALAVGVGYFAGGSGQDTYGTGAPAEFKFDQGPTYAPGSRQAAGAQQQSGSSIDMFRKANENYSADTASGGGEPAARRPKNKKELKEFMRQMHEDMNMDPAAQAAAQASAEAGTAGGRSITNPAGAGAAAQERQAAGAAVRSRKGGGTAARAGSLADRRSAFSAGRLSATGLSSGGGGLRQGHSVGSSFGASATGGAGRDTDGAMISGGGAGAGSRLEAGAYGSHGGNWASPQQTGGGAPSAGAQTGGGGQKEEKPAPAPVMFLWPRSFDFGDMYMYETAARQVILMNIGNAALKVGKIENLDDETPFYLEKDKCSGTTVAAGKSCTFRVRFSPKAVREYGSGFEVPSNDGDAMAYQGYVEVHGNSKYSYSTWWWHHYWNGAAGYNNRLNFGLVPEGYTMDEVLRITNNTGSEWEDIKLDTTKLPSSFKISGDGCTGGTLGPHQSCSVTVTFAPTAAANRPFSSSYYGQYHSVNTQTGAKLYHPRPKFPPLAMEKPVEAAPEGKLRVKANYNILHSGQLVLEVPVKAQSSAPFPVMGLVRVQHYYFFK